MVRPIVDGWSLALIDRVVNRSVQYRPLDIENDQVSFRWKDYRGGDQVKWMTLTAEEFMRRFVVYYCSAVHIKMR